MTNWQNWQWFDENGRGLEIVDTQNALFISQMINDDGEWIIVSVKLSDTS